MVESPLKTLRNVEENDIVSVEVDDRSLECIVVEDPSVESYEKFEHIPGCLLFRVHCESVEDSEMEYYISSKLIEGDNEWTTPLAYETTERSVSDNPFSNYKLLGRVKTVSVE